MSLDLKDKDPKSLTEDERRYLQDRGRLPEGVDPVPSAGYQPLSEFVNTGTANTLGLTSEELDAKLARLAELEAKEAEANRAKDVAAFAKEGSPIEETDDDKPYTYTEENDGELKAELERRGLDPSGDRKTLRGRLVKDDKAKAQASR